MNTAQNIIKDYADKHGNIAIVWAALLDYRERCMPQDEPAYNFAWNDICTAMASIEEELGDKK